MSGSPVFLVTGGSRGIGAAVCRLPPQRLAGCGELRLERGGRRAWFLRSGGRRRGHRGQGDVGKADIVSMFEAVDRHFGRLDGLVNNAGIVDYPQRVDEMTPARLERMLRDQRDRLHPLRRRGRTAHVDAAWRQGRRHRQYLVDGGGARLGRRNMSIMPPPRRRSTPSPSGCRAKSQPRASASMRSGPASSKPTSMPPAACRTGPRELAPSIPMQRAGHGRGGGRCRSLSAFPSGFLYNRRDPQCERRPLSR